MPLVPQSQLIVDFEHIVMHLHFGRHFQVEWKVSAYSPSQQRNKDKMDQELEILKSKIASINSVLEISNEVNEWLKQLLNNVTTLHGRAKILDQVSKLSYTYRMIYTCLRSIEEQLLKLNSNNLFDIRIEFENFSCQLNTINFLQLSIRDDNFDSTNITEQNW